MWKVIVGVGVVGVVAVVGSIVVQSSLGEGIVALFPFFFLFFYYKKTPPTGPRSTLQPGLSSTHPAPGGLLLSYCHALAFDFNLLACALLETYQHHLGPFFLQRVLMSCP